MREGQKDVGRWGVEVGRWGDGWGIDKYLNITEFKGNIRNKMQYDEKFIKIKMQTQPSRNTKLRSSLVYFE